MKRAGRMKNGDCSGREEPERRKPGYNNEERERAGMLWKGRAWRKGESTKWLTIFAGKRKFAEFFFRQGEGLERPLQSAEADSFPKGEAKNAG